MLLGKSKIDITPSNPVLLAGFAHRKTPTNDVIKKIFVRTFMLKNHNEIFLFIIADLIWWDDDFVVQLKKEIVKELHITEEQICFHATHNHSGPQTSAKFSQYLGDIDKEYPSFLKRKVMLSIREAEQNQEEVTMEIGKGMSNVGIYRRKIVNKKVNMLPNTDILTDNELTTITFNTANKEKKAIWIHYTCHPTTTDANILSSEFTGICCEKLEKSYDNCTVAFLQGFCGDVRPNLVSDNEFYRGSIEDMKNMGDSFSKDVFRVIESGKKYCDRESLSFNKIEIPIYFSDKQISHLAPDFLKSEWIEMVEGNKRSGYYLTIQYIEIGENLSFMACNAELVQAYSFYARSIKKSVLPLGYSNGMVGYIPTEEQLANGGYESLDSIFYFGYPSTIAIDMEKKIKKMFKLIMEGK